MPAPVIVIFGITGDLSKRKLLPALYHLLTHDVLSPDTKIIGISRQDLDRDQLLDTVELCVLEKDKVCDPVGLERVKNSLQSFRLDPTDDAAYEALKDMLKSFDTAEQRERLFYMSVPPDAYAPIVQNLAEHGLNDERTRLLVEKPFGYDTGSARDLLGLVDQYFDESQMYRIDHYLAKETAQNLLTFRLHNSIFSALWSADHIEEVHIKAFEKIDIEGRANFYEKTGALRDLIQSHLLQLLALTMMDLPQTLSSEDIHRSKQYFLEQLQPADPSHAIRGQYEGYREQIANSDSAVETFARVELKHAAERWHNVRIILETGKALCDKVTEITVVFKSSHDEPGNNLTFQIQPVEGIKLDLVVKKPGYDSTMLHTSLEFDYLGKHPESDQIDAYERVLMDAIKGDQSLFATGEEVMATWRVLQPLLDAWKGNHDGLRTYPVGWDPDTLQ